jgi:hypothetical protein
MDCVVSQPVSSLRGVSSLLENLRNFRRLDRWQTVSAVALRAFFPIIGIFSPRVSGREFFISAFGMQRHSLSALRLVRLDIASCSRSLGLNACAKRYI